MFFQGSVLAVEAALCVVAGLDFVEHAAPAVVDLFGESFDDVHVG